MISKLKKTFVQLKTTSKNPLYSFVKLGIALVFFHFNLKEFFCYELYDKDMGTWRSYMNTQQRKRFENQCNTASDRKLFVDKVLFNDHFKEYINRDYIYLHTASLEEFRTFCHLHPDFIFKANWLCEGQGIRKVHLVNDSDIVDFYNEKQGYNLAEEYVIQHPKMASLHPHSVNTLRISTYYYNNTPHILAAALRIGTSGECTDNLNKSGLACAVDHKTGVIISHAFDKNARIFHIHPDSNITIKGFQIPNWDHVIKTVLSAAKVTPTIRWIGWDIAITQDSCVIIEGNTGQGSSLLQIGQDGLLPKIKAIEAQSQND